MLSVIGDYRPFPKEIVLKTAKPKHKAPKMNIVRAVTLKKSAGRCISCLNLKT
jgi:hypothetical protein